MENEKILKILYSFKDKSESEFIDYGMDLLNKNKKRIINRIIREVQVEVMKSYDVTERKLRRRSNKRIFVEPRFMIFYFVKKYHDWISCRFIGEFYSLKSSNVSIGIKTLKDLIDTDVVIKETANQIDNILNKKYRKFN